MIDFLLYYIFIGCMTTGVFYIILKNQYMDMNITGFLTGVFLWPLIIGAMILELFKRG